jgi:hypothetical protein
MCTAIRRRIICNTVERKFPATALVTLVTATSTVAAAQGVTVTLSEWRIRLSRDTVPAGAVTFRVNNTGQITRLLCAWRRCGQGNAGDSIPTGRVVDGDAQARHV